jgi:bacterioferritin-associated ferredoxin
MNEALGCSCGECLEGYNDEELLNWTHAHVKRQYPGMQLTDEQIRQVVEEGAYDTEGRAHQ